MMIILCVIMKDSCDEDDYDNIRLMNKWRRHGFTNIAHKICRTKGVLYCAKFAMSILKYTI